MALDRINILPIVVARMTEGLLPKYIAKRTRLRRLRKAHIHRILFEALGRKGMSNAMRRPTCNPDILIM